MAPNLNAYAERFVKSIQSECLDQMIFLGRESLVRVISIEFSDTTGWPVPSASTPCPNNRQTAFRSRWFSTA
jgi:hypothetical protein